MNDHAVNSIMTKIAQAENVYAKAMEMLGVFSAGTIAVVVALRSGGNQVQIELKFAIVLLFVAIIGVLVWFVGKSYQYRNVADQIIKNPTSVASSKEPYWARIFRLLALSSFTLANMCLFLSL